MDHDAAEAMGATAAPPTPDGAPPVRLGRPLIRRWGERRRTLALGGAPAAAQRQAGQSFGAGVATNAAIFEGYLLMLQAAEERLRAALGLLARHGTREPQKGSMPPAQQVLLNETQAALVMVQNAPGEIRDRADYDAAERRLRESLAVIRLARTPPAVAAAEAQQILNAMALLRQSVAAAARDPASGGEPQN